MAAYPAKFRRRWFRFGLRTMFVIVTAFSLWLGWQAKIVLDRREALDELRAAGCSTMFADEAFLEEPARWNRVELPSVPIWRRWLGDRPVAWINCWGSDDSKRTRMKSLFPEVLDHPLLQDP